MIPKNYIIGWSAIVPWQSIEQIEQDLIITTALLKIYHHPILREHLLFVVEPHLINCILIHLPDIQKTLILFKLLVNQSDQLLRY